MPSLLDLVSDFDDYIFILKLQLNRSFDLPSGISELIWCSSEQGCGTVCSSVLTSAHWTDNYRRNT